LDCVGVAADPSFPFDGLPMAMDRRILEAETDRAAVTSGRLEGGDREGIGID
jgi:hypothetical protein